MSQAPSTRRVTDEPAVQRRLQLSLRALLLYVALLSVCFASFSWSPRWAGTLGPLSASLLANLIAWQVFRASALRTLGLGILVAIISGAVCGGVLAVSQTRETPPDAIPFGRNDIVPGGVIVGAMINLACSTLAGCLLYKWQLGSANQR